MPPPLKSRKDSAVGGTSAQVDAIKVVVTVKIFWNERSNLAANFPVPLRPLSRYLGFNPTGLPMNSDKLYPVLALGATAAIIGYALLSRKSKKPPEELEKERRTDLTRGGRILDGNVIDVLELEDDETGQLMILLVYNYDVAGVTYEASQDVTHLRQFIDLYSCRLGLPASVKYDPHNPSDSIVISETWSGLRKPTIVLPPQKQVAINSQTLA